MNTTAAVAWGAIGAFAFAFFLATYTFARNPAVVPPELGHRGLKRKKALEAGGGFAMIEPLMRMIAGWISHLPLARYRERVDKLIVHAGDWLGLTADEFFALCVLSCGGFVVMGIFAADFVGFGPSLAIFFAAMGAMVPYTRLTGEVQNRYRMVDRRLPAGIDLASLCMGAGLDFPGAIRQIVDKTPDKDDPLIEELGRLLQELELGRTRRQALESFAERVPTDAVKDFVGAVIQAEEKGNPLAEVLRIQAGMLRMRRSVMAEESAAKAAVRMIAPLMLIFCSIILLLLGPFIIKHMNGGF